LSSSCHHLAISMYIKISCVCVDAIVSLCVCASQSYMCIIAWFPSPRGSRNIQLVEEGFLAWCWKRGEVWKVYMLGYIVGLMSYKESRGNMPAQKEIEERNYYMKLPYIFIYSYNHCSYYSYYHYYYHYHLSLPLLLLLLLLLSLSLLLLHMKISIYIYIQRIYNIISIALWQLPTARTIRSHKFSEA
jgi:hypothetical protein